MFVWLLADDELLAAAALLAVLGATDWVDGWIARRFDQGSDLGKVFDPVADRILLLVAGVALIVQGSVPLVVGILVLAREVVVSVAVLALAAAGARRIDVQWVGKAGTLALMFAFPLYLWADAIQRHRQRRRARRRVVHGRVRPRPQLLRRPHLRAARPGGAPRGPVHPHRRERLVKAVILAGGEGTRLRPLTSNTPKPMMPLANKPMMEHIVNLLALHGFDEIVVTVAFLANQIRDYFGDGSDFGVTMRYATEDSPLGTAGSVRNAADELDDTFLVISGDVLTDIDLTTFVKAHRDAGASASIALKHVENPLEFGIVITQPDGTIERFLEKPTWGEVFSDTINTGIYVLEPVVFDHIPEGEVVDFSGDVFPALLDDGHTLHGHVTDGYWEDVGTLEAYSRAHKDVLDERVRVDIDGFQLGDRRWIGTDVEISPEARIDDPVVIGDSCRIEAGSHLRPYTVLGTDVIVKADAFIERSVLHDHVYVGPQANLRGCVIGRNTDLRAHVRVDEGTVVGDECFVGQGAVINPNVKVYPFKTVESGAIVTSSIVWESRGARTLFGRRGVRGLANVDINPEVVVRLAMAYSTSIPKGATITDESRHQPHRACAQARADRRHQPVRRQRRGHRAGHRAPHALPGAQQPLAGWHHRATRAGRPRHRRDPLLRLRRPRHRPRPAAQGGAAALPRGLPARVRRRGGRHRVPAALTRVLRGRARARRRHRTGPPAVVQDRARLLVRCGLDRHAEPAHQARCRGAGGQPVREHRVGHVDGGGA